MIGLVLYCISVALLFVLVLIRPGYALTAVILTFLLDQLGIVSHSIFLHQSNLTNIIIGCIVLMAAIRNYALWSKNLSGYGTTFVLVISLLLYTYISALWSSAGPLAIEKLKNQFPYHLCFFVLLPLCMQDRETLKRALVLTLIMATLIAYYFIFGLSWQGRGLVMEGSNLVLQLPLTLAEVAGYLVIISALLKLDKKFLSICLKVAAFLAGVILCLKTGSRGQFLFMLLVAGYFHLRASGRFEMRSIIQTLALSATALVAIYLMFGLFIGGGTDRWNTDILTEDFTGRFVASFVLLNEWSQSFSTMLFGLGSSASFNPQILGFYPHNVYFETLGEEGLIGFVLLLAIMIHSFRVLRVKVPRDSSVVVCGALMVFFYMLSFKQGSLITSTYLFVFPLLSELFTRQALSEEQAQTIELEANQPNSLKQSKPLFNFVHNSHQ